MCGVFGIFGHPEAANLAYLGLHALQHRGQESAGIVSSDGERLYAHRAMGLVQAGFSPKDLAAARRRPRHRPRALLDRRRLAPQQRPAPRGRLRARLDRRRPQRQPRQPRGSCASELEAQRLDLPGRQPTPRRSSTSSRMSDQRARRGPHRRRARAGRGRLLDPLPHRARSSSPCATRWASARCASAAADGRRGRLRPRERADAPRPHRRRARPRCRARAR